MYKIRKLIIFLVMLTCNLALSACSNTSSPKTNTGESNPTTSSSVLDSQDTKTTDKFNEPEIRIRLTFNGVEAIAVLESNPTTQSLLAQLPTTIFFDDFADAEKIAYTPSKLSQKKAPNGYNPEIGDIACYSPWGNLAIYYKDQPYANGLIYMGNFESGLEELSNLDENVRVTIEHIES